MNNEMKFEKNGLLIPNARRARLGARSGCLHPASASWRE